MRFAPLLAPALLFTVSSLAAPGTALAGGLGVIGTGGMHTANAYYYDESLDQGIDRQTRPNAGFGVEALLGARDDRIQGLMRVYVLSDSPVTTPDIGDLDPDTVQYPDEASAGWQNKGAATMGVQWTVWGDPTAFQLNVDSMIGACFATSNSLEFLMVDVGPGVTYMLGDKIQLSATLSATVRHRKGFSYGGNLYAGARFMFD